MANGSATSGSTGGGSGNAAAAGGAAAKNAAARPQSETQEVRDGEEKLRAALASKDPEEFAKAVKSLKVPALKGALRSRSLPLKGKKIELQVRLITNAYGSDNVPVAMRSAAAEVESKRKAPAQAKGATAGNTGPSAKQPRTSQSQSMKAPSGTGAALPPNVRPPQMVARPMAGPPYGYQAPFGTGTLHAAQFHHQQQQQYRAQQQQQPPPLSHTFSNSWTPMQHHPGAQLPPSQQQHQQQQHQQQQQQHQQQQQQSVAPPPRITSREHIMDFMRGGSKAN